MQNSDSFEEVLAQLKPATLTIGTFDGVHLGHQTVIQRLKDEARQEDGESAVLTFENHPSYVLRPKDPIKQICTLNHKIRLFEALDIDNLMLLKFTRNVANRSAEEFIAGIRKHYPFKRLILGPDATFGKDRQGDHLTMKLLAEKMHFIVEYLPPTKVNDIGVSSSRIRTYLEHGDFHHVNKLLGRKYSIYSKVVPGSQNGRAIGFPTANLEVTGLCLPPFGVYAVYVLHNNERIPGIANLGIAPTIKKKAPPQLEVHLFNYQNALYDQNIEVEFVSYLRAEKKFDSIADLQNQIKQDILLARKSF